MIRPLYLFVVAVSMFSASTIFANTLPQGQATRITKAPVLDGQLNDDCWKDLPIFTDFETFQPVAGQKASQRSEVRLAYDNDAIYVAAYLFDTEPNKIDRQLYPRDGFSESDTDYFILGLDTYNDNQNAFRFNVSASGVQGDIRMSQTDFDDSWDAVWESKTTMQKDGWSLEMKIPYSAIRFPNLEKQTWGVQFVRVIRRYNEIASWAAINPKVDGLINQWGDMSGIDNIKPPFRLSLSPYIVGNYSHIPLANGGYASSKSPSGGLDIKYGINESFTLDMTLIPNFGQVQSDNRVRNLSPFEVQYEERRPFFTEGIDLFNKGGIFYSRRIGGEPIDSWKAYSEQKPNEEILSNPRETQLYNATKFSGRTKSKLGIGVINAVAAPMYATLRNVQTGDTRRVQTGYLSNYNIVVLDQILKNNSSVSFINTNVNRGSGSRDANVSALRFNVRDAENRFEVKGSGTLSSVKEDTQTPTSFGHKLFWSAAKISGNFLYGINQQIESNTYDPNDLGILFNNNTIRYGANVAYNWFNPYKNIQNRSWRFSTSYSTLYKPRVYQDFQVNSGWEMTFENQTKFSAEVESRPTWYYDYYEPRVEGKKFYHAPWAYLGMGFDSDGRKKIAYRGWTGLGNSPIPNDLFWNLEGGIKWRPSNRLTLDLAEELIHDFGNFGAISYNPNPDSIIFGFRKIRTFVTNLEGTYTLSPKMNITGRVRHYWTQLAYKSYHTLQDNGTLKLNNNDFGVDENTNLFNVDLVYTWQFAPGSFLNVIWKNAIQEGDGIRADRYIRNIHKTFQEPQSNSFTLKMIYYIDYQNVQKLLKK
jgi:hypothetical protein